MMHRYIVATGFFMAVILISLSLLAQTPFRVNIPGTAFSPEKRANQVAVEDVVDGRHFRGKPFAQIMLRAVLQMHPSSSADSKIQRIVIHFRTSKEGPSLRAVQLGSGIKIETNLKGDYTTKEVVTPEVVANAWIWREPISVNSQTVLRLLIDFPGGIDSQIDPGEFILTRVEVDFPLKAKRLLSTTVKKDIATISSSSKHNEPSQRMSKPPILPEESNGVIYALSDNNDLVWYYHTGREDGSFNWKTPQSMIVGTGWNFKQVFPADNGVIYAITSSGDVFWYHHDGWRDGSFRWASEGKKIAVGWNFEHVFSGGGGVIYAITSSGDLLWYRHDGQGDGSSRWAAPEGKKIGTGWNFKQVFSGGNGVIYAITLNGDLLWYRHDGHNDGSTQWAAPEGKKVGTGWNFKQVFSGGDGGVIYAVTVNGDLLWYRHEGHDDGSVRWTFSEGKKVGNGWNFKQVFSH